MLIAVAREDHANAKPRLERPLEPARTRERHVLFERAARPLGAIFAAAVPGIDHDRAQAARRGEVDERRQVSRRGRGRRPAGGWRLGRRRDDVDDDARRTAVARLSDVLKVAKRGPKSIAMMPDPRRPEHWRSNRERGGGSAASSMSASNRTSRRGPSWATVCGVGGRRRASGGRRLRAARSRPATRGARMSPSRSSREGFRSSTRVPSGGASARGTKSTGTNQVRPSRTGGPAAR